MQHIEEKNTKHPLAPTEPISEPLTPLTNDAPAEDEDDSPDAIFLRAVVEIPTQPLPRHFTPQWEVDRKLERECAFAFFLFLLLLMVTVIVRIINQPVVTVTVIPVQKSVQLTAALPIHTRTLAPATITKSLSAATTGHGHQDAKAATGALTFYNGLALSQTIQAGTVFTGSDGVKIVTDAAVTIPKDNPPVNGQASVSATAERPGSRGNIQALTINTTITGSLFVKNVAAFTGGQDARDYKAVAKGDLDSLTARLQEQLTQAVTQAFNVPPGDSFHITQCTTHRTADHGLGDEAQALTVNATLTCEGVAYSQDDLTRKATSALTTTRPGRKYTLVGSVQTRIRSISPFVVTIRGLWSYALGQDDLDALAQHIQGETPAQARAYLFKTGFVSRVTMTQTQTLPDFYHIKFVVLIGI